MKHILDYNPKRFNSAVPEDTGVEKTAGVNPETGKAWTWLEKFVGVADQGVNVINKYKSGQVTSSSSDSVSLGNDSTPTGKTFLGMPMAIGIGVTVVVVGLIGFGIYKMNKK